MKTQAGASFSDWHKETIMAEVRKIHGSLAELSRQHGLASGTLTNTLSRNWVRGEEIIAQAIGISPEVIWPSRYFRPNGERIVRKRRNRT